MASVDILLPTLENYPKKMLMKIDWGLSDKLFARARIGSYKP